VIIEYSALLDRDMGCHIDGFIAVVAHTHVIKDGPVAGRAADVLAAANTAAEVAMRLVRPGKKVLFSTKHHCYFRVFSLLQFILLFLLMVLDSPP
jgi:hypothetical protein